MLGRLGNGTLDTHITGGGGDILWDVHFCRAILFVKFLPDGTFTVVEVPMHSMQF